MPGENGKTSTPNPLRLYTFGDLHRLVDRVDEMRQTTHERRQELESPGATDPSDQLDDGTQASGGGEHR